MKKRRTIGRTRAPRMIKVILTRTIRRIKFDPKFREKLVGGGYENYRKLSLIPGNTLSQKRKLKNA